MAVSFETLALAIKTAKNYTDSAIGGIAIGVHYKGSINYYDQLPVSPKENDYYTVRYQGTSTQGGTEPLGTEYIWAKNNNTDQFEWVEFGPDIQYLISLINSKSSVGTSFSISTSDWSAAVSPATGYVCMKDSTDDPNLAKITANNNIIINSSNPNVYCSAQSAGSLTFAVETLPTTSTTIKVVILP